MEESLTEKLNKAAAEAHAEFPEKLKNLVVFTTSLNFPSDKLTFVASEIAEHLTNNVAAVKEAIKERTERLHTLRSNALTTSSYFLAGTEVNLIILKENTSDDFSSRYRQEVEVLTDFWHEIGHFVVKNGFSFGTVSKDNLAESAADGYAAFQLGKETDFFKNYNRAHQIVLGKSPIHYTEKTLQIVEQFLEETDISKLSLHETAELAGKIALENHLDDKTFWKLRIVFFPIASVLEKAGGKWNNNVLKECIEVIQENADDSDILQAGIRFLSRSDVKKHLKNEAKTSPYWKDALDFIKIHSTDSINKSHALKSPQKSFGKRLPIFGIKG